MSLPRLARVDRILLSVLLLGALLAAVLHELLAAPEKTGDLQRQPSTFFNVSSGAKGAYEVLRELKYRVTRLRRRISPESLQGIGVLFILRPNEGLASEEVAALQDWVEDGHALIVVPGAPSVNIMTLRQASHEGDFFADWFHFTGEPIERTIKPGELPPAEPPALLREIKSTDRLTAGVTELAAPNGRRFDPKSPCRGRLENAAARVFWKDSQGTIALAAELGDGAIIALADDYPLTNLGISQGDNGLLLANMVRETSARFPGNVAFDEFHLGFAEHDYSGVAILKLMVSGPWRGAAVQVALLVVLAVFARAIRFGSPRGVVLKARRQHREFAEAMGRLFDEAGATSLASETLYRYYRERICKLLSVDLQVGDRQLIEAVEQRGGLALAAELRQALADVQGTLSRQKLLSFSQKLHGVAEALDHGT